MTDSELDGKIREIQKLKSIAEQLENVIETLKDEVKSEMLARQTNVFNGIGYKVIWREQTSTRLDQKLLEKVLGDLTPYKKVTKYKAFYLRQDKGA